MYNCTLLEFVNFCNEFLGKHNVLRCFSNYILDPSIADWWGLDRRTLQLYTKSIYDSEMLTDFITLAFIWDKTKEGQAFWNDISNDFESEFGDKFCPI